jgi:hypothetical protein
MVLGAISASTNALYTDTFTGDGTETDYTLGITPVDLNAIEVYLNGLYQNVGTLTLAANVVTFATAPPSGVIIEIRSVGFLNSGGTLAPATLIGGTGISVVTNSPNNFTISNTLIDVTVSFNTVTGQSLTYTAVSPISSIGQAGSTYPSTTFTVTDPAGGTLSGTAVITGLPAGLTSSQSYNNTNPGNVLTITLSGVYPSANSIGTNLVISGLTVVEVLTVDYLVIAGGGGGGHDHGGGGGAGGLRTSYGSTTGGGGSSESILSLLPATTYSISIGSGGSGGTNMTNGNNSTFSSITSTGGGFGGTYPTPFPGNSGGSGGGAGQKTTSGSVAGGSAVTSPVIQGYAGGASNMWGSYYSGAGGGGASAIGASTTNDHQGGNGGTGLAVNIINTTNAGVASIGEVSGSDVYFAGGGGGCGDATPAGGVGGSGGTGGGGDGDYIYADSGDPGIANTGGGGGGSRSLGSGGTGGGPGGSGVVILRYPSSFTISGLTEATGSPFTEGASKVSVFTNVGTGNIQFN